MYLVVLIFHQIAYVIGLYVERGNCLEAIVLVI